MNPYDLGAAMENWRKACLALETDPGVFALRQAINTLQTQLHELEADHRQNMDEAAAIITASVLELGESQAMHGVTAKYVPGRRTPKWKEIATVLLPPQELIEQHTSVGNPSVKIELEIP